MTNKMLEVVVEIYAFPIEMHWKISSVGYYQIAEASPGNTAHKVSNSSPPIRTIQSVVDITIEKRFCHTGFRPALKENFKER